MSDIGVGTDVDTVPTTEDDGVMSNSQPTIIPSSYCTRACGRIAQASEPFAFFNRDGQRMTLTCGHNIDHVVTR